MSVCSLCLYQLHRILLMMHSSYSTNRKLNVRLYRICRTKPTPTWRRHTKKSAARIVRIISFPFRKRINYSAANTYIQQQQQKHMAHTAAWSVHRAKCVCVPFWSCRWSSSKRRWMKKKKSSTLSNYANFSARCIFSNVFSWWYFAMLLVAISIFLQWNIHYHRFRRSIMIFFLDCLLDAFLYTLQ